MSSLKKRVKTLILLCLSLAIIQSYISYKQVVYKVNWLSMGQNDTNVADNIQNNIGSDKYDVITTNTTYKIVVTGSLEYAISKLNLELERIHSTLFTTEYSNPDTLGTNVRDIAIAYENGSNVNYFSIISKYKQVSNIILHWDSVLNYDMPTCDLPVKDYYNLSWPLKVPCNLDSPSEECTEPLNTTLLYKPFLKPPSGFLKHWNSSVELPETMQDQIFLHIVRDSYLDSIGNVASGTLDIVPEQCRVEMTERTKLNKSKHYDEVFTIAHYWGGAFYHKAVENLPRIVPFLGFLLLNPTIKIHVSRHTRKGRQVKVYLPHLQVLGIDPERIVTGNIHAKVLYVPNGGGCGRLKPLQGQMLSSIYQEYTRQHLNHLGLKRRSILIIKRSKKRYLAQHDEVLSIANESARKYGLRVEVFGDEPVPPFNETIAMFYRAHLIIAPHGAGLSNILFSKPGTTVVEVLCSPPHTNGCYRDMALQLGMPYVGLLSTRITNGPYGELTVDLDYFKKLITNILYAINADMGEA